MKGKFPQLRIVLNTTCGKRCPYCRPSGEASCLVGSEDALGHEDLCACVRELVAGGIREVRLTGGDPAFYPHPKLVRFVDELSKMGLDRLSLVTRSHKIGTVLPSLFKAGMSNVTFSLDSMDAKRWTAGCGIGEDRMWEHEALVKTILCAKAIGFDVSLNSVLLGSTCEIELPPLVEFASRWKLKLKVEEIIRDIGTNGREGFFLHANLSSHKEKMRRMADHVTTDYVYGGLGHPMEVLHFKNGASVTWKMFDHGACYGPSCRSCGFFPCDDALMALRLLPDGRLQKCLKRDDNLVDLVGAIRKGEARVLVEKMLAEYAGATRLDYGEIESLRASHKAERKVA